MKYTIFAGILIFFATVKVIANIAGWKDVSSLATMTNLAPAMKVFTAHEGYETYSGKFIIEAVYKDGSSEKQQITSKQYANLQGPYNRRNVYGALIAYGPILNTNPQTKPMYDAMSYYAFCQEPSILQELDFKKDMQIQRAVITYDNQKQNRDYPNRIEVQCE